MIYFGQNGLGRQYICARCSRVRVLNSGPIVSFKPQRKFGFIHADKKNIYFHFSNLAHDFHLYTGMEVSYEVAFLENGETQAINVKPVAGGKNER